MSQPPAYQSAPVPTYLWRYGMWGLHLVSIVVSIGGCRLLSTDQEGEKVTREVRCFRGLLSRIVPAGGDEDAQRHRETLTTNQAVPGRGVLDFAQGVYYAE